MKLPYQDNPPFALSSLVYIIPGSFEEEDDQPYIVMGHNRSMCPTSWIVHIVPACHPDWQTEPMNERCLTDQPPYDDTIISYRPTRNGKATLTIRHGGVE